MTPLNVAIYAGLSDVGRNGGLEGALIGLVAGLGQLKTQDQSYTIIVSAEDPDWLTPFLGENQRVVRRVTTPRSFRTKIMGRLQSGFTQRKGPRDGRKGFLETLGCEVIHFPYQHFEPTSLPSVYTPHDLQHLHYPEFFSAEEVKRRERTYQTGCRLAKIITVGSEWVKQDLISNYSIPNEKIKVIPWAPPTQVHPRLSEAEEQAALERLAIDRDYILYPAVTWPHKNHVRLLEALALLRDEEGLKLNLVCCGHQTSQMTEIAAHCRSLGLDHQVRFLGFVPAEELRALYRNAESVVIPTLFEAGSGPMVEAWLEETPVACAAVTSLPEQASGAALLFDPFSVEEIAAAMSRLHHDQRLRDELVELGSERLDKLNWTRTAQAYHDVYEAIAPR